ncbi:MAG: MFS transporter [Actinobacteria bacterium]|jgi:MFS family permease|nr:MFS transporter [Actinomycetota bacterium]
MLLLADLPFLRLWLGNTAAGAATTMLPVLLAIAVLDGTGSPTLLGAALAARTLGFVITTPLAGVLADRVSRRRVIRIAALAAAAGTALTALLLTSASLVVLAVAFLAGAGQGAYRPAYQAALADVVEEDHRQAANAVSTLGLRVSAVVAPAAAAALAAWLGARPVLAGTALLWLVVLAVPHLATSAVLRHPQVARVGLGTDFAAGIRESRRHPWFLPVLAALAAQLATGYAATQVLLPVISRDRFGGNAVLAASLTAYTVGALLGALLLTRWRPRVGGWIALSGMALYTFVPLILAVPVPAGFVLAAYLVAGLGVELFNVPWFTAIQREVPAHLRGRVSSLDFLVSYGLAPLGIALIAPAAALAGNQFILFACAVICFLAPLAAATVPGTRTFTTETEPIHTRRTSR